MNKIVIYIVGAAFLLMCAFRILYALFFPDKFAEGAGKVLSLDDREKALFRTGDKKKNSQHDDNK